MKFREASGRARREPGDDPPYYARENYVKADGFLRELKKYAGQIITPDSQGDLAECLRGWPDDDGNDFRYWSARPTDEQREATAWN